MQRERNQGKGRIIGMDIHPECFSASGLENTNAKTAQELFMHHQVLMENLERWISKNKQPGDLYVMEAGSNSFDTSERLKKHGCNVVVLESFRAGQIGKSYLKDDKVDARKIARIYLSGLAHEVWQPDEITRERREVLASYNKAKTDSTRCRNRIWGWCTGHGVKRPKGLKLTSAKGLEWLLTSREWSHRQKMIIESMHDDLLHACVKRKELQKLMAIEIAEDPEMLKLQQLCGLRLVVIYALFAIIGDISRFRNPKKLVAYIGLQPSVNTSGISVKGGPLKHTGRKDLRSLLVQSAHAIIRMGSAKNPMATWGRALKYRKGGNIAVIAVARKLVTYVWYLLRGFFTPLHEISNSFNRKLQILATNIGTEDRRAMGYESVKVFIEEKRKILLAES